MNICVYGASSNDIDSYFIEAVEQLGMELAERGHGLVYGGGAHGLMGAAARGVYKKHGGIIGVAPSFFKVDGVLYENCTEFIYTDTMRERKQIMEDKSEAYIMVPGGIGTFDEFFEMLTLKQLGRHNKPIAIFNVNGYFDSMVKMLDHAIELNFMKPANRKLYGIFDSPNEVLNYIENYIDEDLKISDFKNL